MNTSVRRLLVSILAFMGLVCVLSIPATAQNRGVAGKVTDDKGQPVADAKISIQGMNIVVTYNTKTDKKGRYIYLLGRQTGLYRIVVRKDGYRPEYRDNVKPEMGETAQVDFQLTAGQDYKLPFELTPEEIEQYKKKMADQEKRKKFSQEVKAHFDLGVKMSAEGDYAGAIEEFNKALEKDDKQPGILSRLADAYFKVDKNEEALAAYQKAVELDPNDSSALTNMGIVLNKLGKVAESQEAFKKAAALDPASAARNMYNLGVTMFNTSHYDEAITAFKEAIAADPNYSEAYYQLGMCLSQNPKTIPDSIKALKKYVEIGKKPDQVEVAKEIISALEAQ